MEEIRYEKLYRIREDIKRDKSKVMKLQEQIKVKEAKLKQAEASQIVADVGAMNMSPEQLGQFLSLIQSNQLNAILSGKISVSGTVETNEIKESYEDYKKEEEKVNDED